MLVWAQYGRKNHASAATIRRVIANEAMSSTDPVALPVGADAYSPNDIIVRSFPFYVGAEIFGDPR